MKLIESVPNFSEGRDAKKIQDIADAVDDYAKVLNIESDEDHNRMVLTCAGTPDEILEGTFYGIKKAAELIDMKNHTGTHSRIGATDIVPFIPLEGATMDDCIEISEKLGEKVGKDLGIPVYLYSNSAKTENRKSQAKIRKGQYEGLEMKLKDPLWIPDYGPLTFNEKSGATIIGARKILLAYNVYLSSNDINLAKSIAKDIRESGGGMKGVQAMGMSIDSMGVAQVSMNLLDYETIGLHDVFDKIMDLSGGKVLGSELVGILPKKALVNAGKHYAPYVNDDDMLARVAVKELMFDHIDRFKLENKVIEYMIK